MMKQICVYFVTPSDIKLPNLANYFINQIIWHPRGWDRERIGNSGLKVSSQRKDPGIWDTAL